MPEGIVYILTNPAMPGIVKIGKTTREMDARLNELYSTGVPLPFECAYAAWVGDETQVERAFHQAFGPYRVNPKREFFNIEPEQAIALLELMAQEDLTPAIQREAENVDRDANASAERFKRQRRPPPCAVQNVEEPTAPLPQLAISQRRPPPWPAQKNISRAALLQPET